jgi:hypothetical protein
MGKNVSYDSLKSRLDAIKKGEVPKLTKEGKEETRFGKIRRIKTAKGDELYKLGDKDGSDHFMMKFLSKFNNSVNGGYFENASHTARDIAGYLIHSRQSEIKTEDRLKYLESFNKRIERGIKYLQKDPSSKNIEYMEKILNTSKEIEEKLNPASGLEKTVTVVGILSLVGSLFFLMPNITGNVVNSSNIIASTLLGSGLFVFGIALLFFKRKNKIN